MTDQTVTSDCSFGPNTNLVVHSSRDNSSVSGVGASRDPLFVSVLLGEEFASVFARVEIVNSQSVVGTTGDHSVVADIQTKHLAEHIPTPLSCGGVKGTSWKFPASQFACVIELLGFAHCCL